MSVVEAVKVLTKALKEDEGFYYSYQANIAVQFQDKWKMAVEDNGVIEANKHIGAISNNAAKAFLDLWIGQ